MSKIDLEDMAPKRRRMMDMVMALGGLKEESAIPISRVNEAIAELKSKMEPLTEDILSFPEAYYHEFLERAKKNELVERIEDKGILEESIGNLTNTLDVHVSEPLTELLQLLEEKKGPTEDVEQDTSESPDIDIDARLGSIPEVLKEIEPIVEQLVEDSKKAAEESRKDIAAIVESMEKLRDDMDSNSEQALESIQSLARQVRYSPLLRTTAQVKRAFADNRISQERFEELLKTNIYDELIRGVLVFVLRNTGSKTVVELADIMRIPSRHVQQAMVSVVQRGEAEMVGLEGNAPVFSLVLEETPDTTLVMKRLLQQLRSLSRSVGDKQQETLNEAVKKMEPLLETLQVLGEYDETTLSDSTNRLRELLDEVTESLLASSSADESKDLRLLVSAGLEAFARFRLKITLEKGPNLVSGLNVYGEQLDEEVYKRMMSNYLENELERGTLLILIRELGAMNAEELAERTTIPQDRVFSHLLRMKKDELLTLAGERNGYVLYDVPRTPNEAEKTMRTVTSLASELALAREQIQEIMKDLTAKDIGRLTNSLDSFSKARDKMSTIEVGGSVIGAEILEGVEDKIKSAVSLAYRTRAKIPSTRPKVTIEDLVDIDVPSVMDDYRDQMGYAPLLGFGNIHWNMARCVGCKSCEISCPEDAIELLPIIEAPQIFEFSDEELDTLPSNKARFYRTVRNLAKQKPVTDITLEKKAPGFGKVDVDLWLCVACRTCVRRCPGPEGGALDLELKWNLPDVVQQIKSKA
ncbi:MAG: 4Fe-4S dicluster domain-containing protein [Candidatus Thorarchaeota archaeon]|nr:4Fe-4S dicluster domain-containing protein [Candidatus Thorarchaeota archaeon]